jgi:hypothetical protein
MKHGKSPAQLDLVGPAGQFPQGPLDRFRDLIHRSIPAA